MDSKIPVGRSLFSEEAIWGRNGIMLLKFMLEAWKYMWICAMIKNKVFIQDGLAGMMKGWSQGYESV